MIEALLRNVKISDPGRNNLDRLMTDVGASHPQAMKIDLEHVG